MGERSATRILVDTSGIDRIAVRRAQLAVVSGKDKGRTFEFGERSSALIGTSPDADLALNDDSVSARQAEITAEPRGYVIRDLGSTNGTMVGGLVVIEALLLGARPITISMGESDLKFTLLKDEVEHALSDKERFGTLIGRSATMRKLFAELEKIAVTDSSVLLYGESGTGKERIAESIHEASSRAGGPLVVIDCSSLTPTLVESELFGHERGSFTGATDTYIGAIERAHGGTLFLDEIGELPPDAQPKLLRAIEQREVRRVGGTTQIRTDFRLISASHRDLDRLVKTAKFRADLFYRLAVVNVHIPPLRQHLDDVSLLATNFLQQFHPEVDATKILTAGVAAALATYNWPGNVRELRNAIDRLVTLGEWSDSPRATKTMTTQNFHEAKRALIERFEREYCERLLKDSGGVISRAAEAGGLSRQLLHRLLNTYEIKAS